MAQFILRPFGCWEPRAVRCQAGLLPTRSVPRRPRWRGGFARPGRSSCSRISHRKASPFMISAAKQQGRSHGNVLLRCQIKPRPRRCAVAERELPAGSWVTIPVLRGAARHRDEGNALRAAPCGTGLGLRSSTGTWITSLPSATVFQPGSLQEPMKVV